MYYLDVIYYVYGDVMVEVLKPKVVEKPWGREVWIADELEYGGKILEVKKGFTTSLHYHKVKKETLYVLKGKVKITIKENDKFKEYIVGEGESLTLPPGTIHRIESIEDTVIIEVSTQPLNERVRIEDYYGNIERE